MHDTEEVTILHTGPQVAAKTLAPIGILNRSEAWGLWVSDPEAKLLPHLLISAIPPSSWPLAFQLQAYIEDKNSALLHLTETLKQADVDILFAECGPTGHSHAALNAVCVANGLEDALKTILRDALGAWVGSVALSRHQLRDHLQSIATNAADKSIRDTVFRRIGILMLLFLADLEGRLFFANEHGRTKGFLYKAGVDIENEDLSSGRLRQRFSRTRMPWKLAPALLLQEGSLQGNDGFLKCLMLENPASEPPANRNWTALARDIEKQTEWWTGKDEQALRARDKSAVDALEDLGSAAPGDPFRFYRAWRHHTFDVVRLRALEQLSFFWLFNEDVSVPMAFQYDENEQVLRARNTRDFATAVKRLGRDSITLPARSVVSIDRMERFLRFSIFEQWRVDQRLVLINLPYEAQMVDEAAVVATSAGTAIDVDEQQLPTSRESAFTQGYLCQLLSTINQHAKGSTLRRVSNQITDQSAAHEEGTVRLVLEIADDEKHTEPGQRLMSVVDDLNKAISSLRDQPNPHYSVLCERDVRVAQYSGRRVFVSMIQSFDRRPDVIRLLDEICAVKGLEAVIVGRDAKGASGRRLYSGSISDKVLDWIRECEGFLQVLTLRPDEKAAVARGGIIQPDYGWLAYEYGVADERGLHPVRLVDSALPENAKRAFGVRKDNLHLNFNSDATEEALKTQLYTAIVEIESFLYQRPPHAMR